MEGVGDGAAEAPAMSSPLAQQVVIQFRRKIIGKTSENHRKQYCTNYGHVWAIYGEHVFE